MHEIVMSNGYLSLGLIEEAAKRCDLIDDNEIIGALTEAARYVNWAIQESDPPRGTKILKFQSKQRLGEIEARYARSQAMMDKMNSENAL